MKHPTLDKKDCLKLVDEIKSDADAERLAVFFESRRVAYSRYRSIIYISLLSALVLYMFNSSVVLWPISQKPYLVILMLLIIFCISGVISSGYINYFKDMRDSLRIESNVAVKQDINDIIIACPEALIMYNNVVAQGRNFYMFDIDLIRHHDSRSMELLPLTRDDLLELSEVVHSDDDVLELIDSFRHSNRFRTSLIYLVSFVIVAMLSVNVLNYFDYFVPAFDDNASWLTLLGICLLLTDILYLVSKNRIADSKIKLLEPIHDVLSNSEVRKLTEISPEAQSIYNEVLALNRYFYGFDLELMKYCDPDYCDEY